MKLGVFTPVFAHLSTTEMIAQVKSLRHVEAVELGTGGWPGRAHLDDLTEAGRRHLQSPFLRTPVELLRSPHFQLPMRINGAQ